MDPTQNDNPVRGGLFIGRQAHRIPFLFFGGANVVNLIEFYVRAICSAHGKIPNCAAEKQKLGGLDSYKQATPNGV